MATTKIQKEMTGIVQNFISLWNRYYTLYLENVSRQEITSEKENEFLKFQGTIVEQLVSVLELDEMSRFDIHDKVMSVLNEVVSLDYYTRMSEFQVKRVKHQWQEAMEELEKLYRFCDIYDPKVNKVERITQVKKKNPYWDPTVGGLRDVISRIAVAPVTFFQGIKIGVPANKIGSFIFFVFLIPILIILTIVFLINFNTVKIIGRNVLIEAGLLASDETGFFPSLLMAVAVLAGLLIISTAISILCLILHYIFSWFLHLGFKLTGAKESYSETFKAVTYGTTPVITAIATPYAVILQIIGGSKVHKYSYVLSTIGWIIGTALFIAFIFIVLGATFYFTGIVPPVGSKYAYVESQETGLFNPLDGKETIQVIRGTYLDLPNPKESPKEEKKTIGEKPNRRRTSVYEIKLKDDRYYVEKDNVEIVEFAWSKMPQFVVDRTLHSADVARSFLNKIIKKYSE